MFAVKVAGAYLETGSRVLVRNGQLYLPQSISETVRRQFAGQPVPTPTVPVPTTPLRLVLDAGHGGEDPGAIGVTGLKEKDVNLDIVQRLDTFLRANGVQTTLTRSDDPRPKLELEERVTIANRAAPDLFIAIHANSSRNPGSSGFEIFDRDTRATVEERAEESALIGPHPESFNGKPFPTDTEGRRAAYWQLFTQYRQDGTTAARCIEQSLAELPLDDRGVQPHRLHLLRWSRCPTILVETAFLSNRREEALLRDPDFRQKIAEAIGRGLLEYRKTLAARQR